MSFALRTSLLLSFFLAAGCGESSFGGAGSVKSGKKVEKKQESVPEPVAEDQVTPESEQTDPPKTPDSTTDTASAVDPEKTPAAIIKCLEEWKEELPFTPEELASPEEVVLDQFNNNNGVSYSDKESTEKPKLILVTVASKNVNQGIIELKNENGWYCVDLVSKIANNFTIRTGCKTKVATLKHSEQNANGFRIDKAACPTP